MTHPVLKVENICKSFADNEILKRVDLELGKGEIKILIGPSGGGKSTLLQCINCLVIPDSGDIWFNTEKINIKNNHELYGFRQKVGMIFQDFNLFDHLTAMNNITIALRKVKKMGKKDAQKRAEFELEQVGLSDKSDLYPAELSGGQKQRVAIARALAMAPEVLLLDEPTSALDPELVGEVIAVIKNLAKKGMTMIMATHQMTLVHSLADEILFMENGIIVEKGSPEQLLKDKNSRTLGFCNKLKHMAGEDQ
ncbi:MAG: amino acid ABC transporter ATP-binding protein [Thermodesulfobacteriota bacterium]|nr:amino acid ABC transporter ATP-binding protein [Thermodesulfobacteriota bacterium]